MKQLNISTTNGNLKLDVPDQLGDITLRMLGGLEVEQLTDLQALSILTGVPTDTLYTIRDVEGLKAQVEPVLFQLRQGFADLPKEKLPKVITLHYSDGHSLEVKIDAEPKFYSYGAVQDAFEVIKAEYQRMEAEGKEVPQTSAYAKLLGYLLFNLAYPDKVPTEIDSFVVEAVLNLPANQAIPLAKYFFLRWPNLPVKKVSNYNRLLLKLKRGLALSSSAASAT